MSELFYESGLKFECTQCSKCCRFDPGFVFLSYNDLDRLVKYFKMSENDFVKNYCRKIDMGEHTRLSLIEKSNYDCIFWSNGGCEVYKSRPLQCRSYPFWKPFLLNKEAWELESKSCPGMNYGKLITKENIEEWLKLRDTEQYISF
ncbi:MAG: YkgJ family cysteine cluster protein [Spirochaetia bacterium]|nr:YkgJ family cysteine cluster protein [Spirochaetia bacterium]